MLFTWDTKNLCIVFRQWHIRTTPGLIVSLIAIVLIGMGYEALRSVSRSYEAAAEKRLQTLPSKSFYPFFRRCWYTSSQCCISPLGPACFVFFLF